MALQVLIFVVQRPFKCLNKSDLQGVRQVTAVAVAAAVVAAVARSVAAGVDSLATSTAVATVLKRYWQHLSVTSSVPVIECFSLVRQSCSIIKIAQTPLRSAMPQSARTLAQACCITAFNGAPVASAMRSTSSYSGLQLTTVPFSVAALYLMLPSAVCICCYSDSVVPNRQHGTVYTSKAQVSSKSLC
jgi:hypothetical protein